MLNLGAVLCAKLEVVYKNGRKSRSHAGERRVLVPGIQRDPTMSSIFFSEEEKRFANPNPTSGYFRLQHVNLRGIISLERLIFSMLTSL
jgi:hypothetical protein